MKFELSKVEEEKLDKWIEALKVVLDGADYGLLTYSFTPNGLGSEVKVYCEKLDVSIDLTDVDSW